MIAIFGLFIAFAGILIGNLLEGGPIGALLQFTAALIVFAGTLGATLLSNKWSDVQLALSLFKTIFFRKEDQHEKIAQELKELAYLARKESLLSTDSKLKKLSHPFAKRVLRALIDGMDVTHVKTIFTDVALKEEQRLQSAARVWLDAGGYAPTIGILGAVLGLIHVMSHLTDTSQLGKGIAVAFVATIYGVGSANLIFIPIGQKIRRRAEEQTQTKEMIIETACQMAQSVHPHLIEEKLRSWSQDPEALV